MIFSTTSQRRIVNLEIYDENAIHFHADQLQPIPAMVAAVTYPEKRIKIIPNTIRKETRPQRNSWQKGENKFYSHPKKKVQYIYNKNDFFFFFRVGWGGGGRVVKILKLPVVADNHLHASEEQRILREC